MHLSLWTTFCPPPIFWFSHPIFLTSLRQCPWTRMSMAQSWSFATVCQSMFPLIFWSLCAQVISFEKHFTRNHLYLEPRVWNMCKNILIRKAFCALLVSCVRSSHDPCACAHAYRLEGTLLWAHPTGTSYLSHVETFFLFRLISSASTWKPPYFSVKTLTRVGSASD